MSSGWGSPTATDVNIGGRSPKAVDCREKDRASRRLGLTHSLTSPRTPEPAAKPELPSRPPAENADDLPRPRSLSPPRRTPAPPSVTGSSLSARLERASFVRASNAPPVPPPPQTRARFSAKRGELDDVVAGDGSVGDVDNHAGAGAPHPAAAAAAPTPAGRVEEPLTPTPKSGGRGGGAGRSPGSGSRVAALAMAIESQRQQQREQPPQDDEAPVMTLPAVITAAQAAGLAAEKRMRDSRLQHQYPQQQPSTLSPMARQTVREEEPSASPVGVGMGVKRVSRVRGRAAVAARPEDLVGPRSAAGSSDFGSAAAATSVYGTGKSQIQASPQYWVPRKLSRSPVNKSSSTSKSASYSPARSTRPLW